MELYPFQRKAVRVLKKILRNNSGAVLRADEGVGKTIITASLVETKHTLMVVPARIIKGIREKLDQYAEEGFKTYIDLVSYQTFADVSKLSSIDLQKYKYIVFDECHMLRNYKAGWTTRLCKLRPVSYTHLTLPTIYSV